jgi:outer membrane protein assembly factor BamD (BamD/ComL family)
VPDALYLLGSAHQEAREYRNAIKVYTEFLNRHVDHALAPRTRFLRGFNYNLMNQAIEARADFEAFIERYPSHMLYPEARLWRALSFFSERDYTQTLEALDSLASEVKGQRLEPEVAYRQAATLYAMRDYEGALVSINTWKNSHATAGPMRRVCSWETSKWGVASSARRVLFSWRSILALGTSTPTQSFKLGKFCARSQAMLKIQSNASVSSMHTLSTFKITYFVTMCELKNV